MRTAPNSAFLLLVSVAAVAVAGVAFGAPASSAPPPARPSFSSATTAAPTPAGTTRPVIGGTGGRAGAPVNRAALPPARSVDVVLADVVTALGGAAALGRHRSMHTKMEITFKGLGITGTAEHYATVGDRALTITEIPNLASTREGSDGTRFWSDDPINGLRLLEGVEAEQARAEVAWNAELRMKELFAKIEVKNEPTPAPAEDGSFWECLVLTAKSGPGMTNCFDSKTHLLAMQKGVRSGPQGEMPFTARLSDWRTVADIKIAYATEMHVGPLAFDGRVTAVELDVPIKATLFEIPKVNKADKGRRNSGAATGKPSPAAAAPKKDGPAKQPTAPPADAPATPKR